MTVDQFFTRLGPGLAILAIGFYLIVHYWRRPQRDYYAEWLTEVMRDNPGYKPPYIVGPEGKWVENPAFTPNQLIVHSDEPTP